MKEKELKKLRSTLTKPNKNFLDLRNIYDLLAQTPLKASFFKQVMAVEKSQQYILDLCKGFEYKFYPKGETVFEEGDTNTEFLYIIIRGTVGVYIRNILEKALMKAKRPSKSINSQNELNKSSVAELKPPEPKPARKLSIFGLANMNSSHTLFNKRSSAIMIKIRERLDEKADTFFNADSTSSKVLSRNFSTTIGDIRKNSLIMDIDQPEEKRRNGKRGSVVQTLYQNKLEEDNAREILDFKDPHFNLIFHPKNEGQQAKLKLFEKHYLKNASFLEPPAMTMIANNYGNKVRELSNWTIFGELSRELAQPRTATIVAHSHTEIIRINQAAYKNIIKTALKVMREKNMEFLSEVFKASKSSIDKKIISSLIPSMEKLNYKKGEFIIIQGQPCENLYLIRKGEIKLVKTIREEPTSVFYQAWDNERYNEVLDRLEDESIQIGLCGTFECIGEDYLFNQLSEYELTAECYSLKATIYKIKTDALRSLPPRFIQTLRSINQEKMMSRISQFNRSVNLLMSLPRSSIDNNLVQYFTFGASRFELNDKIKPTEKMCTITKARGLSKNLSILLDRCRVSRKFSSDWGLTNLSNVIREVRSISPPIVFPKKSNFENEIQTSTPFTTKRKTKNSVTNKVRMSRIRLINDNTQIKSKSYLMR